MTWTFDPAGEERFSPLRSLQLEASNLSRESYVQKFPWPVLRVADQLCTVEEKQGHLREPSDHGVQLLTQTIETYAILRYLRKFAFVAKREGNPFSHMISIGRSRATDITLAVDSVSKVHGYFVDSPDGWMFTDHGSTNGSWIDEQPTEKGRKYLLSDGTILKLGLEAAFEYLTPVAIYDRLVG